MDLKEARTRISPLLDRNWAGDAMATYFAYHHGDDKTGLVTYPEFGTNATGYVALSRTGIDLFRPFVTLRLPPLDLEGGSTLLRTAIPVGVDVIMNVAALDMPLVRALFSIQKETQLQLYALEPGRIQPAINVVVEEDRGSSGLPRFVVRQPVTPGKALEVVASAGLNWQSPNFAEIAVYTHPLYRQRGWGRSVVSALAAQLMAHGRRPLYAVELENEASIRLVEGLQFVDTGVREFMVEAQLQPDTSS